MAQRSKTLSRITFNSPVTLGFVFICLAVQIASELTGGRSTAAFFTSHLGPWNDPLTYFCLVSHIFGHSGWEHLMGNMGYILILGPMLEEKYGSGELALIMLASGLAGSISNMLLLGHAIVGASGVVFTFILLSSFTQIRDGQIPLTFILVAVFFLGQQLYGAFFVRGNISYLGHIAGGIVGSVIGFVLPPKVQQGSSSSGFRIGS